MKDTPVSFLLVDDIRGRVVLPEQTLLQRTEPPYNFPLIEVHHGPTLEWEYYEPIFHLLVLVLDPLENFVAIILMYDR